MLRETSEKLFAEALHYLPGGVHSPVRAFRAVGGNPFFTKRAYGARLEDVDGNAYVDYVGTWGPAILGHAPQEVVQAITEAAQQGTSFGTPHTAEVELAKKISEWVSSVEKVRLTNSGTEATMTAIRLARGVTRRDKIIKFEGCYHGHVDSLLVKAGSGALTLGKPDSAGVPACLASLTLTLPFNDLEAVKHVCAQNQGEIAAIILEPIPANAGLIPPQPGYLEGLRKLCDQEDILLIFDEVMTGFRLGKGGAQELLGIQPDLSAFGKVIGGGLPVGAIGGPTEIMDALAPSGPVYQAGTLSGNPLAMAAGLKQLHLLERDNIFAQLEAKGRYLEEGLQPAIQQAHQAGLPLTFHRYGSMFCLFFASAPIHSLKDVQKADLKRFAHFFHLLLDQNVYFPPSQFETCFLSSAHTDEDLDTTIQAISLALAKVS